MMWRAEKHRLTWNQVPNPPSLGVILHRIQNHTKSQFPCLLKKAFYRLPTIEWSANLHSRCLGCRKRQNDVSALKALTFQGLGEEGNIPSYSFIHLFHKKLLSSYLLTENVPGLALRICLQGLHIISCKWLEQLMR